MTIRNNCFSCLVPILSDSNAALLLLPQPCCCFLRLEECDDEDEWDFDDLIEAEHVEGAFENTEATSLDAAVDIVREDERFCILVGLNTCSGVSEGGGTTRRSLLLLLTSSSGAQADVLRMLRKDFARNILLWNALMISFDGDMYCYPKA